MVDIEKYNYRPNQEKTIINESHLLYFFGFYKSVGSEWLYHLKNNAEEFDGDERVDLFPLGKFEEEMEHRRTLQ